MTSGVFRSKPDPPSAREKRRRCRSSGRTFRRRRGNDPSASRAHRPLTNARPFETEPAPVIVIARRGIARPSSPFHTGRPVRRSRNTVWRSNSGGSDPPNGGSRRVPLTSFASDCGLLFRTGSASARVVLRAAAISAPVRRRRITTAGGEGKTVESWKNQTLAPHFDEVLDHIGPKSACEPRLAVTQALSLRNASTRAATSAGFWWQIQ